MIHNIFHYIVIRNEHLFQLDLCKSAIKKVPLETNFYEVLNLAYKNRLKDFPRKGKTTDTMMENKLLEECLDNT